MNSVHITHTKTLTIYPSHRHALAPAHIQLEGGALSTESEMRIGGDCFRCGGPGHWADSEQCPWLIKAESRAAHLARLDSLKARFLAWEITPHQRHEYMNYENRLWYDGKIPAHLAH